jgi:hypothetical protein
MDWPAVIASFVGSAIAVPAAAGLSSFLSNRSIERQKAQQSKELLETQNAFSMGATSHMATVAFDKHIGFCEEYVEEMSKALDALIRDGIEGPLSARKFFQIRQKWALWLTQEIETELDLFERAITQIGGAAQVLDANGSPVSNESSIKTVIAYLRGVLRTEETHRAQRRTGYPFLRENSSRRVTPVATPLPNLSKRVADLGCQRLRRASKRLQ